MQILYLIHSHPSKSIGGAENAATAQFKEIQTHPNINTRLLSADNTNEDPTNPEAPLIHLQPQAEFSVKTNCDPFLLLNTNAQALQRALEELESIFKPDIVHIHHFLHFGIDLIHSIKNVWPSAKIILTLHEFLLLCHRQGQMATRPANQLCTTSTPEACNQCYPSINTNRFEQRQDTINNALKLCDQLVSPSQFLAARFIEHGIREDQISIIENGLPDHITTTVAEHSKDLNRFGFFGKVTELKGILVLLKAILRLNKQGNTDFHVDIYGGGLEQQPAELQHRVSNLLSHISENVITLHGRYQQSDLPLLMGSVDWVIVPSIWWENSPVVIQEAFACRRPVIGSDIGGTAEKIRGLGGRCFAVADHESLASVMAESIGDQQGHQALQQQIPASFSASDCAAAHLDLYRSLLNP